MDIVIRVAVNSDFSEINEVSKHLGYNALSQAEANEKLNALINSDRDEVYVSVYNGGVIGWLHLFYARRLASDDFYEIGGLVVKPEFRGTGVGRSLVNYALGLHEGKCRVRCNERRVESHQFYKATGFSSNKIQRVFELNT